MNELFLIYLITVPVCFLIYFITMYQSTKRRFTSIIAIVGLTLFCFVPVVNVLMVIYLIHERRNKRI